MAGSQTDTLYGPVESRVLDIASKIKLLVCDVDGVFSDGRIYLGNDGEELKAAVQSGKMTKEQAIKAWNQATAGTKNGKAAARPAKGKMGSKTGVRPGSFNFYAVVIGRLRSKDIELGPMERTDGGCAVSFSEKRKRRSEACGNVGRWIDRCVQLSQRVSIHF